MMDNLDLDSPLPSEITVFCENNTDKWFDFTISYEYEDREEEYWVGIDFGLNFTEEDAYNLFKEDMKSSYGNMWVFDTRTVIQKVVYLAGK